MGFVGRSRGPAGEARKKRRAKKEEVPHPFSFAIRTALAYISDDETESEGAMESVCAALDNNADFWPRVTVTVNRTHDQLPRVWRENFEKFITLCSKGIWNLECNA